MCEIESEGPNYSYVCNLQQQQQQTASPALLRVVFHTRFSMSVTIRSRIIDTRTNRSSLSKPIRSPPRGGSRDKRGRRNRDTLCCAGVLWKGGNVREVGFPYTRVVVVRSVGAVVWQSLKNTRKQHPPYYYIVF